MLTVQTNHHVCVKIAENIHNIHIVYAETVMGYKNVLSTKLER